MNASLSTTRFIRHQRGYTLIEIMIALLVALFLLAGLGTLVAGTRRTGSNQMSLAQLQDEQRLAMSMLNDVIQNTGYFDSNTYYTVADAFKTSVTTTGGTTNITLPAGQRIGRKHTARFSPQTPGPLCSPTDADPRLNRLGGSP